MIFIRVQQVIIENNLTTRQKQAAAFIKWKGALIIKYLVGGI